MTAMGKSRWVGSGICKIIVLSAYTGGKNVPFDVILRVPIPIFVLVACGLLLFIMEPTQPRITPNPKISQQNNGTTYNIGDSLVVTDLDTNPTLARLSLGDRTGSRVL